MKTFEQVVLAVWQFVLARKQQGMKTFEQVVLAVWQFVWLLGWAGSVIAFAGSVIVLGYFAISSAILGMKNPYIHGSTLNWALAIPKISIVVFLYSFGMWVVFSRVRKLQ